MAKNSESIEKVGENAKEAGKRIGNIMVGVDIDVSDALKGLKAVQREAKKTAQVLRAIEGMKNFNPTINITMNATDDPKKFEKALKTEIEKLGKEWR